MILLDTCTLLWLSEKPPRLPPRVIELLRTTAAGQRYVSAITAFEIGVKYAQKRLALPKRARLWFDDSCALRGLVPLPVSKDVALRAAELPPHHKDPADRIIIASAIEHGLTILTPDPAFRRYKAALAWE